MVDSATGCRHCNGSWNRFYEVPWDLHELHRLVAASGGFSWLVCELLAPFPWGPSDLPCKWHWVSSVWWALGCRVVDPCWNPRGKVISLCHGQNSCWNPGHATANSVYSAWHKPGSAYLHQLTLSYSVNSHKLEAESKSLGNVDLGQSSEAHQAGIIQKII